MRWRLMVYSTMGEPTCYLGPYRWRIQAHLKAMRLPDFVTHVEKIPRRSIYGEDSPASGKRAGESCRSA